MYGIPGANNVREWRLNNWENRDVAYVYNGATGPFGFVRKFAVFVLEPSKSFVRALPDAIVGKTMNSPRPTTKHGEIHLRLRYTYIRAHVTRFAIKPADYVFRAPQIVRYRETVAATTCCGTRFRIRYFRSFHETVQIEIAVYIYKYES